jgi:hypothetical protein
MNFIQFIQAIILPLREAHPDHVRLDGRAVGTGKKPDAFSTPGGCGSSTRIPTSGL